MKSFPLGPAYASGPASENFHSMALFLNNMICKMNFVCVRHSRKKDTCQCVIP